MSQGRLIRVNRLLRAALCELVPGTLHDPRIAVVDLLAISDVRVSPDLRHAKVFVTVGAASQEAVQAALVALKKASGHLRTQLGRRIELKYTPQLTFLNDEVRERATRVDEILREISEEELGEEGSDGLQEDGGEP